MTTKENLEAAFAGESQANRRYLAFAIKADQEGKPQIARLFRAAAEAETVHAHNHLGALAEIKSTQENLKAAISGEKYEHTKMYPEFLEEARKEEDQNAVRSFDWANQVEKIHEDHFQRALETIESGKDLDDKDVSVCPVCGNTFLGDAPETCPICQAPRDRFIKIE
jgi:rubrerythrin